MFPWKTIFTIDTDSKRPIYLQLADQFIKQITAGRIQPGMKIPGSRSMAELLKVNRKTIIQTYGELIAQDWLEVKSSAGTFVSQHLPMAKPQPLETRDLKNVNPPPTINSYPFIESYTPLPENALVVNGGSPDPRLAPVHWLYKESRASISARNGYKLLRYGDARGNYHFRKTLAHYLSESRGMLVNPENIQVTRGSQMGIFLAMSTLLKPHDSVVVGEVSYDAADWAIEYHGGKLVRIPVDEYGLNIELLEKVCRRQKINLVYVTPHHHFPTTVTLSNTRRMKLLELALKYNFYILEDDYDYDFHYKSASLLPLASINQNQHVIYIGSFSKIFAPNIRVGYLVAPVPIIEEISKVSRIIDRQGDQVIQHVMAEAIVSGELDRHLKKSLKVYRERRDHLVTQLKAKLTEHVHFKIPEGGMAIWITFTNYSLWELKPYFEQAGLYLDIDPRLSEKYNAFRFGYASLTKEETTKAINLIEKILRQLSSSTSSSTLLLKT